MHHLFRDFTDPLGRAWRVSELFATHLARELARDAGHDDAPIPLVFLSGAERRWVNHAPAHWWDLPARDLAHLLEQSRELPPLAVSRS